MQQTVPRKVMLQEVNWYPKPTRPLLTDNLYHLKYERNEKNPCDFIDGHCSANVCTG